MGSLDAWRERFVNHPLVATETRRLIWAFDSDGEAVLAGFDPDGDLVDLHDRRVNAPNNAVVRLWHPVGSPVETVRGWRDWLEHLPERLSALARL